MNTVEKKLIQARKELLDLGLRNPLINQRTTRGRGLDVVDEVPANVYEILVSKGSKMTFLHNPAAEDTGVNEDDIAFEQPEADDIDDQGHAARHTDTRLQTAYSPSSLQRRLLNTYYFARTSIEEQGVNTLFLTLGMLHWYEDESSEKERRAPLILVPVSLSRASVESKFNLTYNGDEIGPNLSLKEKLKAEFSIDLPIFDELTQEDLSGYFAKVTQSISSQPRWSVDTEAITIGFFAFAKFLMYKDLDGLGWEGGSAPHDHETIKALLDEGFSGDEIIGDGAFLDDKVDPADVHFVVDADSSQAQALMEIRGGQHQVIQGPPGTGKSQTITNIIADALGRGQKVLFVAEKMAALDVVKRRLSSIGIGDACLELHSNKTNKKAFLDDLKSTLTLKRPVAGNSNEILEDLIRSRDKLNQYCDAVNEPIGKSGIAPVVAYGKLLKLGQVLDNLDNKPQLVVDGFEKWSGKNFRELIALCKQIQAQLQQSGVPSEHPFWGTELRVLPPSLGDEISATAQDVLARLDKYQSTLSNAVSGVGINDFTSHSSRSLSRTAAQLVAESPIRESVHILTKEWNDRATIQRCLEEGHERSLLLESLSDSLVKGTWDKDVVLHRSAVVSYGEKWWRFFVASYRDAKRFAEGHSREAKKYSYTELLEVYDQILRYQELDEDEAARLELLGKLATTKQPKTSQDWDSWIKIVDWSIALIDQVEQTDIREGIVREACEAEMLLREERYNQLVNASEAVFDGLKTLDQLAQIRDDLSLTKIDRLDELSSRLASWVREPSSVQDLVVLNHQCQKVIELDASALLETITHWSQAQSFLVELVEAAWYRALVERAFMERQELAVFSGAQHEEIIRLFKQKDLDLFDHNKRILALKHFQNLPKGNATGGQLGVLRREFEKKRRHMPIRTLMLHCGNAIQAIKPVFMMSPLSIATYIPPGSAEFDLVIFDEASQVKPVDAFGALVRAKQAVVVGDSRQLPPTSFFDSNVDLDDEELEETDVAAGDMESILSLFAAQGAPEKMLRWHYRSRHESLIAISNMEFYDNRLFIFPSPYASVEELGLIYHYLPTTVYERGSKKSFNRGEAKAVAKAVMGHAAQYPDLTLGVAAFSMKQMNTILDELEVLRRENPFHEGFFSSHPEEPFFVKNLENVQGDERDVIFISIGYGKDENGYVAMNFGPLNRDGGERRLNVLITRARKRCEVFSNLTADDIDLHRTQAAGVRSLKRYLKYAKDDIIDVPDSTGQEADSDFELAVAEAIQDSGHKVDLQVGSAGFRIDIGVVDPKHPGRYLLGIECDGATYHSARWARDRDRIRQSVLEGLGWNIHRVWSTDWFRSPQKELEKILVSVERAKSLAASDRTTTIKQGEFQLERDEDFGEELDTPCLQHYATASLSFRLDDMELHEVSPDTFARYINEVVSIESPVHTEEVLRKIREAAGVGRAGQRIRDAFNRGVRKANHLYGIRQRHDFLWSSEPQIVRPRDRSQCEPQSQKFELIAPEEIKGAILFCVEHAYGISPDDVPAETILTFGFKRTTQQMRDAVNKQLKSLLKAEALKERGGHLFLSNGQE